MVFSIFHTATFWTRLSLKPFLLSVKFHSSFPLLLTSEQIKVDKAADLNPTRDVISNLNRLLHNGRYKFLGRPVMEQIKSSKAKFNVCFLTTRIVSETVRLGFEPA